MRHSQWSVLSLLLFIVLTCGYAFRNSPSRRDSAPVEIGKRPLPEKDNEQYAWVEPGPDPTKSQNCGNCHAEIYREWAASGHARSATNRRFLNLYDGSDWNGKAGAGWSLLADHPDGAGVCTACHAPSVDFSDAAYYDLRMAVGTGAHGVHCDYCHKIAQLTSDQFGFTHGRFALGLLRPSEGQLVFGPLEDVKRDEDRHSPLYRDSRYCAACHEGIVFGVHVYSTFSEWLQSPARKEGKACQSCHMLPTGSMTNVAPGQGGIERDAATLGNHRFFAGNRLDMVRSCLKLTIQLAHTPGGTEANIELSAANVGHRVPTGFVDRNLVVVLEAFDAADRRMPHQSSDSVLPAVAGSDLVGLAGRLYAKQLCDFEGHQPAPFWRAQPDFVDSRLVPGREDRMHARYLSSVCRVRLRMIYRPFWPQLATTKGWPDDALVVWDKSLHLKPGESIRWCSQP
jgi:hypothetical protein